MARTTRDDAAIDAVMPHFELHTRYAVKVRAPASSAYAALRRLDLGRSPLVRLLFLLRGMPRASLTLPGMLRLGMVELAVVPDRELVLGAVGRFWTPRGDLRPVSSEEFLAFDEPGFAKVAWGFHAEDRGAARTLLTAETRIACTDGEARRRFRRYWRFVGPFSAKVRKEALRLVKKDAEAATARAR